MDLSGTNRIVLIITLGCFISIAHRFYLSHLFENEYRFSHLASHEREITLKSESAFYYSFYKRLLVVKDKEKEIKRWWLEEWLEELGRMQEDTCIEYPTSINTIKRFNLYPEIVCSFAYNSLVGSLRWVGLPSRYCYLVNKGVGEEVLEACDGIGEPICFYLECVFTWNGILVGSMFAGGIYLSNSILGGILCVLSFLYNHADSTRVELTPALRESFSFPFWIIHTIITFHILKVSELKKATALRYGSIVIAMLLTWQFSPFVLLIHIFVIFLLAIFTLVPPVICRQLAFIHIICILISSLLLFLNPYVLTSLYSCACVTLCILLYFLKNKPRKAYTNVMILLTFILITLLIKKCLVEKVLGVKDDNHVFDILQSKISSIITSLTSSFLTFSSSSSFHTKLYTCAPEFDFIDLRTYGELTKTFLLPTSVFVFMCISGCVAVKVLGSKRCSFMNTFDLKELSYFSYLSLSTVCYLVLATLVMRLKLFLVPSMCLMTSILAHSKFPIISQYPNYKLPFLFALISLMSFQGIQNVLIQTSIRGSFEDGSTEGLLEWISEKTSRNSVFAGSMSSMSSINLYTQRCTSNHPHYENQALRDKTMLTYTVYSRKDEKEIWNNMKKLGVDYVLLESAWCFGSSRVGCSLDEIWRAEEDFQKDETDNKSMRRRFCADIFNNKESSLFSVVYNKTNYRLLKVL